MAERKRGYAVFTLLGMAIIFFTKTGYDLSKNGNIDWKMSYILSLLFITMAGGVILGILSVTLLRKARIKAVSKDAKETFLLKLPVSWTVIFLFWLPCFLAYYPAICAYDTPIQLGQCAAGMWNDHHPYIHTWVMNAFWQLGKGMFGNADTGMALYALFQMTVLSGAFAVSMLLLKRRRCRNTVLYLLLAFSCLYPYHMFMAVSVTKDSLFAPFLLLAAVLCYCILIDRRNELKWNKTDVALLISVLPAMWFRNNARYAVMLFVFLLLLVSIFGKREKKLYIRMFLVTAAGLLLGLVSLSVSYRAANVQQGDRREMLSMPIQQLARTMYYHEDSIEPETRQFLGNVMLNEAWKEYNPAISDPVKRNVYTGYIKNNFSGFIKIYLQLFLRYPGDFINAALAVDAGYLYPFDTSCMTVNMRAGEQGLGYVQTAWDASLSDYGITENPVFPWLHDFLEGIVSSNAFLKWPVVNLLFFPGWLIWVYLYTAAVLWYKRQYRKLIPLALVGGYFATLLLGPTVQLRYIYPVTICLPYILAAVSTEKRSKGEHD